MGASGTSTFSVDSTAENSIVTVTLQRPQCLDVAGKKELTELFLKLAGDEDARAVILASKHPEALLVDVSELARMSPFEALQYSRAGQQLMEALEALPTPTIAAVTGPALGGGCELILACDMAFCGEDATFGQIEANGGVVPAFGGTWRLVRRVGFQRASRMIYTGAILDAETAAADGLVLDVLPSSELVSYCHEVAAQICAASGPSVSEAKRILIGSWGRAPETSDAMEQAAFASLFGTADQRNRMDAFIAAHDA